MAFALRPSRNKTLQLAYALLAAEERKSKKASKAEKAPVPEKAAAKKKQATKKARAA